MKPQATILGIWVATAWLLIVGGGRFLFAVEGDENWDSEFGVPGVKPYGVSFLAFGPGGLYLGGSLNFVGGVRVTNLARWDGTNWSAVGGFQGSPSSYVRTITTDGEQVWIGGQFSIVAGVSAKNVVRWDRTNWMALGTGVGGLVEALAVVGTNVYAGGQFTSAGGVSALRIAKWDGSAWSGFGAITNVNPGCRDGCDDDGAVFALAATGTDLYVGGRFVFAGTVFATNIAKWDGTRWSAVGTGLDDQVTRLLISGSSLYAIGNFRHAGGVAVNSLARWDGQAWHDVGGGPTDGLSVSAAAVNGKELYVSGPFREIGGVTARGIARWDGLSWSRWGAESRMVEWLIVPECSQPVAANYSWADISPQRVEKLPPTSPCGTSRIG